MSQGRSNIRQPRAPVAAVRYASSCLSPDASVSGDPFRIGPAQILSAEQWHERGIRHEQAGDLQSAIQCYRSALAIQPVNTQILFDLAYALAESGKIEAAIERYRQITEVAPDRQDAWVNLGDLLLTAGQDAEGVAVLRHAVQLDPSDYVAKYNLRCVAGTLGTTS